MTSHEQAGIVAFVGGLATIGADSLTQAALVLGAAALIAAVILLTGRGRS